MRYIKYTYVDALTGVPVSQSPALNGPREPRVAGLEFTFALESEYPTTNPIMYGICPDDAETNLPGVIGEITEQEHLSDQSAELIAREVKTIREAKEQATVRINHAYDTHVKVLAEGYTKYERESWPIQAEEARVVMGEDDRPTPWINASAAKEGVTRIDLATRIGVMDQTYRAIHGELSAIRRLKRDEIEAAALHHSAIELLNQIQWPEVEDEQ